MVDRKWGKAHYAGGAPCPIRGTRQGGPGCPDLVTKQACTIWADHLSKKIDQDFCPLYKKRADDNMVHLFLVPPKWAEDKHRWVTHTSDPAETQKIPPTQQIQEMRTLDPPPMASTGSKWGSFAEPELPQARSSNAESYPSRSQSQCGSYCSSCRNRDPNCCECCGTLLSLGQKTPKGYSMNKIERAKSAPMITRQIGKAKADYGRPTLGQFYNYALMHKKVGPTNRPSKMDDYNSGQWSPPVGAAGRPRIKVACR